MGSQINTTAVEKLNNLLNSFSANFIESNSSEILERSIFVTNFIKSINDFDLSNEDNIIALNTFIESLVSYKFPISIIYSIYGTSGVDDLIELVYAVNTVVSNTSTTYGTNILNNDIFENIYITIIHDKAIADLTNSCIYDEVINNKYFIRPIIETTYITSDNYFNTIQQAYKSFYTNTSLKSVINTDLTTKIKNKELLKIYEYLKATFNSAYDFPLFAHFLYKNMQYYNAIHTIINFTYKDSLPELFKYNVYRKDVGSLLLKLSADLVPAYISRVSTYIERDLKFTAAEYIGNLKVSSKEDLTLDTLKYESFKALVSNSDTYINNITEYVKEIAVMQEYLNNIYNCIKNDSKFLITEV